MGKFSHVKHIVRYTTSSALILYFGVIAVLNIPFIQNRLTLIAEDQLSELLKTEVHIGNVNLGLLNRIIIQNITVKDQHREELLKVSRLSAKFDILPFFHGKIRISNVQLFGMDAKLNRPSPQQPTNFQFVIDAFASKDSVPKENNINLRINTILVRRGKIHYDVLSQPITPNVFNPAHIGISNLSATLSLKALTQDSINVQIRRMSLNEQSGFTLKKLSAKLVANKHRFSASNFKLSLPNTQIDIQSLSASYDSIPALFALEDATRYSTSVQASVTPADISMFVPALSHFHSPLLLQIAVRGEGHHVECNKLTVENEDKTLLLKAEATANHWNSAREMFVFGKVSELSAEQKGVYWLLRNLTGEDKQIGIIDRLGDIRFNGDTSGYLHQLTTRGVILSDVGEVDANITMHKDTVTEARSFSGKVVSTDLKLGTLLGDEKKLGNATFDVELKGLTYKDGKANTYIKGNIASLTYQQYEYHNINLDGQYTPGGFDGKLSMNDENGDIEISGHVATQEKTPEYNLRASIRNFHPHELHLTDQYKDTDVALNLIADFRGHSIDDMQGQIRIDSVNVTAPTPEGSYFLKELCIEAGKVSSDDSRKRLSIRSPFMTGTIDGDYSYRTLPVSILKTVRKYIPSLIPENKTLAETNNDFSFQLKIDDTELFEKVFSVPIVLKMPATVSGCFSDKRNNLYIKGDLPDFAYNGTHYESGNLLCENAPDGLRCQIHLNKRMSKGSMLNLAVNACAANDNLKTTVNWGNNTASTFSGSINANTRFNPSQANGKLSALVNIESSDVILNDTIWKVHPAQVAIENDKIEIKDFLFEHEDQHLKANGCIGKSASDSCLVDLKNINLQYVMDIIQFKAVKFNGMASGLVHLKHVKSDPDIHGHLSVKDFSLNDALLGQAEIGIAWDKELGIKLQADIPENDQYRTNVTGFVSPQQKGLDLHIQANGTTLSFLQPFIDGIFSNAQGRAFGNIRLYGPFSDLDLEGRLQADASMKVNILNTTFNAHADSVVVTSGLFKFDNVQLTDMEGHTGTANGTLQHHKLKNLAYNFRFNAQDMLVYHTEKETPDFPFYGTIYATGNVRIHGNGATGVNVDGSLKSEANTLFTYVTATAAEATNNQFITFVDKTPRRESENIHTELYHHLNANKTNDDDDTPGDIHINLQVEATPEADMRIIMDPIAGDYISARGNGNLQINFFNKEDFLMFGNYNIVEGIYKMSMQNVIRKDFTLRSGGIVSFNGDPRQANLNVQAVYTVNSASLNDLVANASSAKSTIKVNCLLNLTGNLTSPDLKFDLDLPTVNEEDKELVRSLTNTEEQMNTQIIYLLGIGKFYTNDYANNNSNQSDATSSLAFSTLSGQLNNMLSQVINSQHWNVGTNLSTGEKGWSDVEAEAILSGRLLNNRLIINGNFGYRDNPLRNSNFVGDFEALWLLTKNGEWSLKGYNQTNDRYFTKSTLTTQGIGIIYKKDFSNWREMFDWLLLKKRNKRSTTTTESTNTATPVAKQKREQNNK